MDEETIDNIIIKNNTIKENFIDKIVKTIEKNKNKKTTDIARIVEKHCKRESVNNIKKRNISKNNTRNTNRT